MPLPDVDFSRGAWPQPAWTHLYLNTPGIPTRVRIDWGDGVGQYGTSPSIYHAYTGGDGLEAYYRIYVRTDDRTPREWETLTAWFDLAESGRQAAPWRRPRDLLEGGLGADLFCFAVGEGLDRILDFVSGEDRIALLVGAPSVAFTDLVFTG